MGCHPAHPRCTATAGRPNHDDARQRQRSGAFVDQRADLANAAKPDAIISIHADGGPPAGHGFHVNYSNPPVTDVQAGPTLQLATTMRDALVASGLTESNYIGSQGLYGRADLAGLNFAQYPAILVELGNMKNAGDVAQIKARTDAQNMPRP